MRQKILFILALLCAIVQGAWADEWATVYTQTETTAANWTALNTGSTDGKVLGQSGTTTYYYITGNLSFTNNRTDNGGNGNSGLKILGTVYLYIPTGMTLSCTGANADGRTGGGAGIELTAGNSLYLIGGGTANVTLADRTLYKDGKWNTLCLPFDLTIADSPLAGATARPLNSASIEGTTLNLMFGDAVTELVAGTPYIIKWTKADGYDEASEDNRDLKNPAFSGVVIDKTERSFDNEASGDAQVRFIGTYKSTTFDAIDNSILLMGGENKLYYPTTNAGLGAQRAYFKIGDGTALARQLTAFNIDFGDGETTGVISIHNSQFTIHNEAGAWYDLSGRKFEGVPTMKGVYIHNGHKVIIK